MNKSMGAIVLTLLTLHVAYVCTRHVEYYLCVARGGSIGANLLFTFVYRNSLFCDTLFDCVILLDSIYANVSKMFTSVLSISSRR